MSISFQQIFSNCYHFMQDKIPMALTPLQKKVAWIALACIGVTAVSHFIYQSCFFKAHKTNDEKNPNINDSNSSSSEEENLDVNNSNTSPSNPAPKPPIPNRIEKNRKFAECQQAEEKDKSFSLAIGEIPQEIKINLVSSMPLKAEKKIINELSVGIADCQGVRKEMEDAHLAEAISFQIEGQPVEASVFGVFDGHGDKKEAADFVQQNLVAYLTQSIEKHNLSGLAEEGIFHALKECFINLDAAYQREGGTTATVAILLGDTVWFANVGDSRSLLVKEDGSTTQATEDAKPTIKRYKATIEKLGGCVVFNKVLGSLAVARSIGDKDYKTDISSTCVSAHPKITCYPLADFKGGALILACDGLFDVATSNQVGKAWQEMKTQGLEPIAQAQRFVQSAIASGSSDNVTVMVVNF